MTDDDPRDYFRRWHRREYLRQHEQQRRAAVKAEGGRRIDVTLRGQALDDYATVRRYIEELNRSAIERGTFNTPKRLPDGRIFTVPAIRLSDTEIVKRALSVAAFHIEEDERRAASRKR